MPAGPSRGGSEILREPQSLVDGRVDIARGDRVADPVKRIAAVRIPDEALSAIGDQSLVVDLAEVARARLEREIEILERQRAMLDHDLIDEPLASGFVVFVEKCRR